MTMLAIRQSNLFFLPQQQGPESISQIKPPGADSSSDYGNHFLENILAGSKIGIWTLDLAEKKICLCKTARAFFGILPTQHILIYNLLRNIRSEDRQAIVQLFKTVCRYGEKTNLIFRISEGPGRTEQWLQLTAAQHVPATGGKAPLIAGTIADITALKQLQLQAEDCMSMLSHELRSPLTTIKLYMQMLGNQTAVSADARSAFFLQKVDVQAAAMERMIKSFLAMSVAEYATIQLVKEQFDMLRLISDTTSEMQLKYPEYRFFLEFEGPAKVTADRDKIVQVLTNYISNAVKYAPKGSSVTIRCQQNSHHIVVAVIDQGCGLSEQDQLNLFEKYYRSQSTTVSGFGLGLYLVKKIIEAHSGRVGVASSPGKGSVFSFVLPL
jgi:signal transduction histidine kinase